VLAANAEVAAKLTALMQSAIDRGRSTAGEAQKNDYELSVPTGGGEPRRRKKNKDNAGNLDGERQREIALAADPSFD
jgi:hypothetical protein